MRIQSVEQSSLRPQFSTVQMQVKLELVGHGGGVSTSEESNDMRYRRGGQL